MIDLRLITVIEETVAINLELFLPQSLRNE